MTLVLALMINILLFAVAYQRQTDRFTDITYASTFAAVALVVYIFSSGSRGWVSAILLVLVGLWAFRLGTFLGRRIHRIGRDKRFDEIRPNFWKFGRFWTLQGLSVWIIMIPSTYLLALAPENLKSLSAIGLVIWLAGFAIETFADNQKFAFTQNPDNKGKWIESGLWKYSRHPNYLGEMMVWIGIYIFALPYLSGWSALIALISPLWICSLLLFVTGVPTTEQSADKKWGNDPRYKIYKKRTPVLIPAPQLFRNN